MLLASLGIIVFDVLEMRDDEPVGSREQVLTTLSPVSSFDELPPSDYLGEGSGELHLCPEGDGLLSGQLLWMQTSFEPLPESASLGLSVPETANAEHTELALDMVRLEGGETLRPIDEKVYSERRELLPNGLESGWPAETFNVRMCRDTDHGRH